VVIERSLQLAEFKWGGKERLDMLSVYDCVRVLGGSHQLRGTDSICVLSLVTLVKMEMISWAWERLPSEDPTV